MTLDAYTIGRYVQSTQGRDAGKIFIVVGTVDENHVLIADGDIRPIGKPKKKKVKHLIPKQELFSSLREKLVSGEGVYDAHIRKDLKALRDQGLDAPCKEVK